MNGMGNEPSYKGTGGIGISVKIRNRISTLLLILLCLCLGIQASTEIREDSQWTDRLNKALSWKCMDLWCPSFNYADYGWYQDNSCRTDPWGNLEGNTIIHFPAGAGDLYGVYAVRTSI